MIKQHTVGANRWCSCLGNIEESSQMTNVCVYIYIYLNLPLHGISIYKPLKKKTHTSSVLLAPHHNHPNTKHLNHHPPWPEKNPLIGPGKGPKNVTFKRIRRLTVEIQGPSRLAETGWLWLRKVGVVSTNKWGEVDGKSRKTTWDASCRVVYIFLSLDK